MLAIFWRIFWAAELLRVCGKKCVKKKVWRIRSARARRCISTAACFQIYAGTSPKQTEEVLDISIDELRDVVRNGISNEELKLMKEQTIASILLGLEDSASRAGTLARLEMVHGRQISLEETIEKIEAVSVEEIREIAREFFQTEKIAFGALGNLNGLKIKRERLEV